MPVLPSAVSRKISSSLRHFPVLVRRVNEAFERGYERAQAMVETEKARTYWEVGRFIEQHVLFYKDRADYDKQVIARLSRRTGKSPTLLYDCLRFARQRPILPARVKLLPWGIHKGLLGVEDPKKWLKLETSARKQDWSTRDLALKIRGSEAVVADGDGKSKKSSIPVSKILKPKRGEVYHYRVVIPPGRLEKAPQLDLGFLNFMDVPGRAKWKEGDVVRTRALDEVKGRDGKYGVVKAKGPRVFSRLYTYWAFVERVVDGDTLVAWIEFGFGMRARRRLRLRGLDAPELAAKRGKSAKAFVESQLKYSRWVILTTTTAYDRNVRYLSDVFTHPGPSVSKDDLPEAWASYLNGKLLEKRLAEPV